MTHEPSDRPLSVQSDPAGWVQKETDLLQAVKYLRDRAGPSDTDFGHGYYTACTDVLGAIRGLQSSAPPPPVSEREKKLEEALRKIAGQTEVSADMLRSYARAALAEVEAQRDGWAAKYECGTASLHLEYNDLQRRLAEAVEAEREACAAIADNKHRYHRGDVRLEFLAQDIASTIRSRSILEDKANG